MALFARTPKKPTTVAEALEALVTLKNNLSDVIAESRRKADFAREKRADAEAYAARIKAETEAEEAAAEDEIRKAENADAALAKLLGEAV